MDCNHEHAKPTGELRIKASCRASTKQILPVYKCDDCGEHLQLCDGKWIRVGPPPPIDGVIMSLRRGIVTMEQLRAAGYLSEIELAFLATIKPCAHEHTRTTIITVCTDCGHQTQQDATE